MFKKNPTKLILLFALCYSSLAAESFTYPELNVAPLSSTRLKMEAKKESRKGFFIQTPLQISAMATIMTSVVMLDPAYFADRNDNKIGAIVGMGAGITTLALPYLLGRKKFQRGYGAIAKLPATTKRQKLLRERMAEEELREIRSFSWKIRIISSVINIGALGFMVSQADSESIAAVSIYASMLLTVAPLVLSCPWKTPMDKQDYYKKRIYGPIASATILNDPKTNKPIPGLFLGMRF